MSFPCLALLLPLAQGSVQQVWPSGPDTLGLVVTEGSRLAVTFDPTTSTVLGSVGVTGYPYDCALTGDLRTALVGTNFYGLRFLTIEDGVPSLAPGVSSVFLGGDGHAIELTPDDRFALIATSDGSVNVVDVAARLRVDRYVNGPASNLDCVAVDDAGRVLVGDVDAYTVELLQLDASGILMSTGAVLPIAPDDPQGLTFLPGSSHALVLARSGRLYSFSVPGMQVVNVVKLPNSSSSLGGPGYSFRVWRPGESVLVRTRDDVLSIGYGSESGRLDDLRWLSPLPPANVQSLTFGADYLGLDPSRGRVWTSLVDDDLIPLRGLQARDIRTGAVVDEIVDPIFDNPGPMTMRTRSSGSVRSRSDPQPWN